MMKKLYALLVILIVLYIGINVGADVLNLTGPDATVSNAVADGEGIALGSVNFAKVEGFKEKKINDTAVRLNDSSKNMTIDVYQIDNSRNISDIADSLIDSGSYTSNQVLDQNGVTTFYLYKDGSESYDAEIYFEKNNQNYEIRGEKISYDSSDYFINSCKTIIDTLGSSSQDLSDLVKIG